MEDYRDRGNQSLVVAENLHVLTHLLILTLIPSFLHFLTAPDNTSSSERDVGDSISERVVDWTNL